MSQTQRNGRIIFHIDMNSFYASVEVAYDPSLKGKPLAIAGNAKDRKGIVVTSSYEARKYGVKAPMPLWEAKKLCPSLIVRSPNFERYRSSSKEMFSLLREYTDLVEPVSIDEGYMDLTNTRFHESAMITAKEIQQRLLDELLLPSSIGIAPNKFLAKMASNMKKPLGITVLRKRELKTLLWPMPIHNMHGIGEKTAEKLLKLNITTIGDLAHTEEIQLKQALGVNGTRLKNRALGIDTREVNPDSINEFKSIGNSSTLPHDSSDKDEINNLLQKLSASVSRRLKRKEVVASKLSIMIRYADWKTVTRHKRLNNPTDLETELVQEASALFYKHWNGEPIRLAGITGMDLIERDKAFKQLDLFTFTDDAKKEPIYKLVSKINEKYGTDAIKKGLKGKSKESNSGGTSFNKDFLSNNNEDE
ncbi:DNA polymerase IV [Bacillus gobiensis]|uniref:DNA polymerase IV n=1 Tax=Bacillus gobiensis TaxID=1441095 RepID=UPI003D202DE2